MSCSPSATSQNPWPWPSSKKWHFMPAWQTLSILVKSVVPAAGGLSWTPSSVVGEMLELARWLISLYFMKKRSYWFLTQSLMRMNQVNINTVNINTLGFPGGSVGKESVCSAAEPGFIPELGRSSGERNGNPLQYSYLENPMDRGAWRATVHGITKSRT